MLKAPFTKVELFDYENNNSQGWAILTTESMIAFGPFENEAKADEVLPEIINLWKKEECSNPGDYE